MLLRCCSASHSSRLVSVSKAFQSSSSSWLPGSSSTVVTAATTITTRSPCYFFSSVAATPDRIKELRVKSGAPVVECKKALEQADGDITKAMDWLREHGAAKASSKLRGRDSPEGLVALRINAEGTRAALVKVNSETDFAGRSPTFLQLIDHVANATLLLPSDAVGSLDEETLLAATFQSKSVQDVLNETIVSIRENLRLSQTIRLQLVQADDNNSNSNNHLGRLVGYVHGRVDVNYEAGTAAAIVQVQPSKNTTDANHWEPQWQEAGKKLAMHIVAAKPLYLSPNAVPAEALEKERSILAKQLEDSKKPPDVIDKIVTGRMRKFYEESCLTEQAHMVEEGNPKVSKVLDGLGLKVTQFVSLTMT